jgi:hypothetical protein
MAIDKTEIWIAGADVVAGVTPTTQAYVFDLRTRAWHHEDKVYALSVSRWSGPQDLNELMIGAGQADGTVRQYSIGVADIDAAGAAVTIDGFFTTGRLDFGNPETTKQLRHVIFEFETAELTIPDLVILKYALNDGGMTVLSSYTTVGNTIRFMPATALTFRYLNLSLRVSTQTQSRVRVVGYEVGVIDVGPRTA